MVNFYKILELQRNASPDDIKRAYRKLALKWHPDKNPHNKEEAEKKFKAVAEAYEVLSDPQKRYRYDREPHRATNGASSNTADFDFIFRCPDDVFKEFFGGMSAFATDFWGNLSDDEDESRNELHRPVGLFSRFGDFGFSSFGPRVRAMFSCKSFGDDNRRTIFRSVSTSTEVINGRQITTRKIVENGQERIEVEEDGQLMSVKVNGREQLKY